MSQKNVSFFENAFDTVGKGMLLNDILLTDSYFSEVKAYREIKDVEQRRTAKLKMPMFTPSGLFEKRCKNGLIQHTGLICLDIDGKENPGIDMLQLKNDLSDIAYYAGLSISGKGLFVIVPIKYPERHEAHFDSLFDDFADMGITIDKACRDVSRARFVSYDAEPIYNPDAPIYSKFKLPEPVTHTQIFTNSQTNIEKLTRKAIESRTNITKDYLDWFALACSLRHTPGGRDIFHALSRMDERYNHTEADKQFNEVLHGTGYNEAKFFEICKRHGITLKY